MAQEKVLQVGSFDPRLKTYELIYGALLFLPGVLTIVLLPIWLLGLGQYICRRRFEALDLELTERSLNFSKGIIVRVQKNVPLDKITDLAVIEGPLLRAMGLVSLKVETAGQSAGAGALVSLVGIEDAMRFRDAVLKQRDHVTASSPGEVQPDDEGVLRDIRDSLLRIEDLISGRS